MRSRIIVTLIFVLCLFSLTSCAPKADYDIRGEWDYTMIDASGVTYDIGTIIFSGNTNKGTYIETNIYDIEYEGEYSINGSVLKMTGDENWEGLVANENEISGTWVHLDESSGTFTAARLGPMP